jgi:hypothetical protein
MGWLQMVCVLLRSLLRNQAELAAENLVLRQQLAVLEQSSKRPRLPACRDDSAKWDKSA